MKSRLVLVSLCAAVAVLGGAARGDTLTWKGPAGGDWFASTNWSTTNMPAAGDDVVVTNGSVLLTNSSPLLRTFTITNATLTFTNWNTILQCSSNIDLRRGGTLTLPGYYPTNAMSNNIYLVCQDLNVRSGATINASSGGWQGGYSTVGNTSVDGHGPGYGPGGVWTNGGGSPAAGHGGQGGPSWNDGRYGAVYGVSNAPVTPGSGGGQNLYTGYAGPGGGAVRIHAAGTVTINGSIAADGGTCIGGNRGGSGAGGSVYITCRRLEGLAYGAIRAQGGDSNGEGGGGGGGRIAVWRGRDAYLGVASVAGGINATWGLSTYGKTGTVFRGWLPDPMVTPTNQFGRGFEGRTLLVPGTSTNLVLRVWDAGESPTNLLWSVSSSTPWITLGVTSGSVPVGGQGVLEFTTDAAALLQGIYTGTVSMVASNVSMAGIPAVERTITVLMTVINPLQPVITSIVTTNASGEYGAGDQIDVTVTFSEPVTLSGGTLDVVLDVGKTLSIGPFGPADTVSCVYTVGAADASADLDAIGVSLSGGFLTNAAEQSVWMDLPGLTIADVRDIVIGRPTVTLSSTAPDPTSVRPIPIQVTFSKAVTGFFASDVVVSNATLQNFAGSGANYSFDVFPPGHTTVTVRIPAAVAQDSGGTWNGESATLSRDFAFALNVSVNPPEGGEVQGTNAWYTMVVTNTAVANPGYTFLGWSGADVPYGLNSSNPIVMVMDRPRTIVANFVSNAPAMTRVRNGSGLWLTASNWAPYGIPNAGDSVVLTSGVVIISMPVTVQDVLVTNNARVIWTNWNSILTARDVTVCSNAQLGIAGWFTNNVMSNNLHIACRNFRLDLGAKIDVNSNGYAGVASRPGQGPGAGGCYNDESGGGGHGGRGGEYGGDQYRGPTNDSANAPVIPGSSGGARQGTGYSLQPGGAGGGAVRIRASGTMTLAGTVLANGETGAGRCGGGSGGAVYLMANTFLGSGTCALQANGGDGGGAGGGASGGGGGGRIAVWRAYGGFSGSAVATNGLSWNPGNTGSVVFAIMPDPDAQPLNHSRQAGVFRTLVLENEATALNLKLQDLGDSTNHMYWGMSTTNDWIGLPQVSGVVSDGLWTAISVSNNASGKAVGVYTGEVFWVATNRIMTGGVDPVRETLTIEMNVVTAYPPSIISITSTNADGSYGVGAQIDITVNFSEPVTLSGGTLDITLDTGRIISMAPFGPAATVQGVYTVQAGDSTPDLDATAVTLNGGTLVNGSAQEVWTALPATTIADLKAIDIGRPTVTLSSTAPDPTYLTPIPVTVVFSTNVVGFDTGDLLVSNATVSAFLGSGANYSFNLIPVQRGTTFVQVVSNGAQDGNGNGNIASAPLTRLFSHQLIFDVRPQAYGDVTGTDLWYNATVTLVPAPGPGCYFRQWTGTGVPWMQHTNNPLVLTMDRVREVAAIFGSNGVPATTRTWSGTGPWFTLANWTPQDFPYPGDAVRIPSGNCLIREPQSVASLTVTNGTLTFTNWNTAVNASGNILVQNGGLLTTPTKFSNGAMSNNVCLTCANLAIEAGGRINVNSNGYRGGYSYWTGSAYVDEGGHGTGGGQGFGGGGGSGGGGHGGKGGNSYGNERQGGPAYGSSNAPVAPGSGGGVNIGGYGGDGGGAIRIEAGGRVTVDGVVSANGGDRAPVENQRGGGGSGGSIYITCRTIGGSGSLTASGGGTTTHGGGSGAGGRIAVWRVSDYWAGTVSVTNGVVPPPASLPGYPGDMGTIVWGNVILPKGTVFTVR